MKAPPSKGVLVRGAAADVMRHTLSQIPTVFGQLVYLSKVRNATTGKYEHHGLSLVYGEEESDSALRNCHAEAFSKWLSFGLEQQKADLDLYLSALEQNRRSLLLTWLKLRPYENLIPSSARRSSERRLYVAELDALVQMMANESGVAFDPDA